MTKKFALLVYLIIKFILQIFWNTNNGSNDDSISGYARPRNRPTGPDFEKIFKSSNIDLNSNKKQIIKGYEKED